jgi:polysaccharide export outer membrane protein
MTMLRPFSSDSATVARRVRCGAVALTALALAHFASEPASAQSPPSPVVTQSAAVQGFASSSLRPGDALRVRIWREPDLSGEFTIDESGVVMLPKLGAVRAVDEPVGALKTRIISSYATYITQPVEVTPVLRVRVLGAVKTPGLYKVEPAMTLADAIALAGGTSPTANDKRIRLIRDGQPLDVALTPDATLADSPLRPGDQVFVPERSWLSRNPGAIAGAVSATATLLWAIRR